MNTSPTAITETALATRIRPRRGNAVRVRRTIPKRYSCPRFWAATTDARIVVSSSGCANASHQSTVGSTPGPGSCRNTGLVARNASEATPIRVSARQIHEERTVRTRTHS